MLKRQKVKKICLTTTIFVKKRFQLPFLHCQKKWFAQFIRSKLWALSISFQVKNESSKLKRNLIWKIIIPILWEHVRERKWKNFDSSCTCFIQLHPVFLSQEKILRLFTLIMYCITVFLSDFHSTKHHNSNLICITFPSNGY